MSSPYDQLFNQMRLPKNLHKLYGMLYEVPKPEPKKVESRSFGPMCRCGARNTARIGESSLIRQCQACGQTYAYRLKDGILVPHALETAIALDGR